MGKPIPLKVVYEDDVLTFTRNEVEMTPFSHATDQGFARPAVWDIRIPVSGHGDQHLGILRNFTEAILDGAPLIAPAESCSSRLACR